MSVCFFEIWCTFQRRVRLKKNNFSSLSQETLVPFRFVNMATYNFFFFFFWCNLYMPKKPYIKYKSGCCCRLVFFFVLCSTSFIINVVCLFILFGLIYRLDICFFHYVIRSAFRLWAFDPIPFDFTVHSFTLSLLLSVRVCVFVSLFLSVSAFVLSHSFIFAVPKRWGFLNTRDKCRNEQTAKTPISAYFVPFVVRHLAV